MRAAACRRRTKSQDSSALSSHNQSGISKGGHSADRQQGADLFAPIRILNLLRQVSYEGQREDKPAKQV